MGCHQETLWHVRTQQQQQRQQQQRSFNGLWSGTTRVGWYHKKHSPTRTHPDHRASFIIFLHLQRSMASSLFNLRAWQSSRVWTHAYLLTSCMHLPPVLWHCSLGIRKSIWPVKREWWRVGVVVCLKRGAHCLHMVPLMPLHTKTPLSHAWLNWIQTGFTFLVPDYPGFPGKEAGKWV